MLRPALDLVLSALEQIQETTDRRPCASRDALARLFTESPVIELQDVTDRMEPLRRRDVTSMKCPHLVLSRTQTVFGVGNPKAELRVVG